MSWDVIGMLALVAFCAGFFDAIAGGGGLITLPALLLASVDPISAIATNKFQAASATISATVTFARKGMIEWREGRFLVICGFVGGASGALLVSSIDKRYLEVCVPIMLILVAIYFALSPKLANEDRRKRIGILLFSFTVAPILGFYDGIFGPGVGVQHHRNQHDQVSEADREQRLPPVHPDRDEPAGHHVRRDAVRHRDPQRGVVVRRPGAARCRDRGEVGVEERARADVGGEIVELGRARRGIVHALLRGGG